MRASIITPVYNAVDYIRACVENVVGQGDSVVEHIFADGGSKDGTVELIQQLQQTYPHIRLLPGPDRGQSDAMNKATAMARGEVIGILNADDFYEPDAVARGLAELARMPKVALVCGDCRIIDADGNTIVWNRPKYLYPEALLQDSWLFPIPANPSAYFYTREVHDIVGGYDVEDSHAMDCEFLLTCAERVTMRYVPEHWGNFRYIPGCKTFEDASGAGRVATLIRRHKQQLNTVQLAKMKIIRVRREATHRAGAALRRYGLRR